jgi:hypothetical protein
LEEEFLDKEEFDPRTAEGSSIPRKAVAPGAAGRSRPKKGLATDLKVKIPIPVDKPKEVVIDTAAETEVEEEEDPFDTSIVDKVIPVEKAKQRSDLSVEDIDFDPASTFEQIEKEEYDPFDTSIAGTVIPELAEPEPEPEEAPVEIVEEKPLEVPVLEEPQQPEPIVLEIDGQQFKILPPAPPRKARRGVPAAPVTAVEEDFDFDPRS